MPIRKILVPLSGHDGFERPHEVALEVAFDLGGRFGAHVEAFHASGEAVAGHALIPPGLPGSAGEELMQEMEQLDRERGERARDLFASVSSRANPPRADAPNGGPAFSVAYVERAGPADELIAGRGRLSDLIVCAKPPAEQHQRPPLGLEAALRESGRPVLITPDALPKSVGTRIAIGWNGSVEAARALSSAWDFVAAADEVVILAIEDDDALLPTGADLVEYLGWHGIASTKRRLETGAWTAGGDMLSAAVEAGADLMIMGTYSHNLMRRLIFGITGLVLTQATIPVLMAE